MGNAASKGASDVGTAVGNAIAAPFKSIFGRSCQDICSGIWDVECFIEHLCIPDLVKLLLVCGLSYVCLVFLYLLFKLGVCQCVVKSLCKISWAACETCWLTLDYICCFCWYKIRHTKRVYRRRHREQARLSRDDVELGYASTSTSSNGSHGRNLSYSESVGDNERACPSRSRKRKSRHGEGHQRRMNRRKNVTLKTGQVSVRLKGRPRRGRRSNRFKHSQRSSLGRSTKRSMSIKFKKPKLDDP
ncbi:hypothetical protein Cgig2_028950 [Carnegiea gigantea]|uniref:Uncharacterized protein n=1 Tax=Carnegiea gigantea TaxID=171969 RepID=A0A9Q1JVL3_9CARY|nr:hypothetical protein Cgig2_028950 [Carnegiea gigantea]